MCDNIENMSLLWWILILLTRLGNMYPLIRQGEKNDVYWLIRNINIKLEVDGDSEGNVMKNGSKCN